MTTTAVRPDEVTDELFEATLRQVVAENPDFVYPSNIRGQGQDDWHNGGGACVYAHPDGSPACVIGHVVYRLTPELLPSYKSETQNAADLLVGLYPKVSSGVRVAATEAQSSQDDGSSWQEALDNYETWLVNE